MLRRLPDAGRPRLLQHVVRPLHHIDDVPDNVAARHHQEERTMDVTVIDTPQLGDRSYLVHDGEVAFVVDPQRDIDRVLDLGAIPQIVRT